jgi:transposase
MIRSSRSSLRFANIGKREELQEFIDKYRTLVQDYIDILWPLEKLPPSLLPKEFSSKPDTILSARIRQCAGKQARGIVWGTRKKQEQRKWQIDKFNKEGMFKKARRLQEIYNKNISEKPNVSNVEPELDSRFTNIDLDNETSFDGWINLSSLGNSIELKLPFKKNKHFNKLLSKGKLKAGIRISPKYATFMFEIPDPKPVIQGKILGIDIGKNNVISCSNGFMSVPNKHGHDLNSIISIMSRRKKGSKGFRRSSEHRTNYINWSINKLNLDGVQVVNRENIKYLRKGKRTARGMSHWTYASIFDKVDTACEERGVLVRKLNPTYTSQRCSKCGWVRKGNRKGKWFRCDKCSLSIDSDLNASLNLSLNLEPIGSKKRLSRSNRKGFYWIQVCQEPIVPDA